MPVRPSSRSMPDWWSRARISPDVACVLLIVAVLTIVFWPVLASGSKLPPLPRGNDWLKECAFNRSAREAILRDRQFPLRSHYLGGGYPVVAYPEDSSLSPLFLTTLLFGENVGLKVKVFIKLLVGGLGMYYLLRVALSCARGGAVLGSLLFGLSEWFHVKTGAGYIGLHNYCFLPLMMALLVDAARGRRSVVLPSLIFALMLVEGKFVIAISLLFLCLWGLLELVQVRRGAIVLRYAFLHKLAIVVCVGCLVSMAKILPMLELLGANPRTYPYDDLGRPWAQYGDVFYDARGLWMALDIPRTLDKAFIGLGWLPVALALLSAALNLRSLARWVFLLLLFTWLSMGFNAPFDLWRVLWHLPVFQSINKPALWLSFFVLMPLCVLAACPPRGRRRTKSSRVGYAAYLCAGAVGVALLLQNAYRLNADGFTETLDPRPKQGTFFHVKGNGKYHTYHNMIRGIGSIDWDGDILLPECAVPRFFADGDDGLEENPSYRGEVWLLEGKGNPRLTRLTPNAIDVEVESPGRASIVVNQNFHSGWRSSHGRVVPYRGLLSVEHIPGAGPRVVRLRYSSLTFSVGLAVTVVALAAVAYIGLKRLRAHGLSRCLVGTEPPAGRRASEVRIAVGAWSARKRLLVVGAAASALVVLLVLVIPPIRADYVLHSAELLQFAGRSYAAAEMCRGVLQRYPDNRLAHEILGACYFDEGRWEEVVAEFRRAMQLGTMQPESYAQLATAYENLGQPRQAEQIMRELMVRTPYDRGVWDMMRERGLIREP